MKTKRQFLRISFLVAMTLISARAMSQAPQQTAAEPQTGAELSSRPIRLITPFPAGGSTDALARTIAPELAKRLGTVVVVENKTGASGIIGLDIVAKAEPDGHTIGLVAASNMVINTMLLGNPPYNPATDFAPIAFLVDSPVLLVATPWLQVNNVSELLALERTSPGGLSFASAGNGTTQHLAGEMFNIKTGTKLVHVPYRGTAPAIVDLLGGQVQLGFADVPAVTQHAKAGRIQILGTASKKRIMAMPDLPTIAEQGVDGYDASAWFGAVAPAGTPPAVVQRLNAELTYVMKLPHVKDALLNKGLEARPSTSEEFSSFLNGERKKWGDLILTLGPSLKQ